MENIIITILAGLALLVGIFSYWKSRVFKDALQKREKDINHRMYELTILKELGERIGYSLDVQKIIDIIIGSLNQFIEYSAVSYMLFKPENIVFKVHFEKSVSRKFIDDIEDRMLKSLSALLDKEFQKNQVEETLTGAVVIEDFQEPVRSFFNIPLIIGEKVVGVLTIAHTKADLYKEDEMTILYKITKQASDAVTRLQAVVETEQRKLNAMVESMAEGIVMIDKDYRIKVVNPAARRAVGFEDPRELSIFDFIDKLGGKFDIRGRLEESIKLNKILIADEILINERFFQIFVSPVKSDSGMTKGKILGAVVIFHDITHDKEVEAMREDFTSMIVHELRTPLDGIKKLTEIIMENGGQEDEKFGNEYLRMVYGGSSNMLELVNDLLDVAKLESGKFEIYKEPSDVKQIIENRLSFFEISAKDAKIELCSYFGKNLPEKTAFDHRRISQVLTNLISNALKFTEAGGRIIVQALLHKKGRDINEEAGEAGIEWFLNKENKKLVDVPDSIVIAVTDTGIGISPHNLSQLFSKFKQLKARALRQGDKKGTGLGLAIAKGIVEAHKGLIGVESEEGMGSTFYFTIPI